MNAAVGPAARELAVVTGAVLLGRETHRPVAIGDEPAEGLVALVAQLFGNARWGRCGRHRGRRRWRRGARHRRRGRGRGRDGRRRRRGRRGPGRGLAVGAEEPQRCTTRTEQQDTGSDGSDDCGPRRAAVRTGGWGHRGPRCRCTCSGRDREWTWARGRRRLHDPVVPRGLGRRLRPARPGVDCCLGAGRLADQGRLRHLDFQALGGQARVVLGLHEQARGPAAEGLDGDVRVPQDDDLGAAPRRVRCVEGGQQAGGGGGAVLPGVEYPCGGDALGSRLDVGIGEDDGGAPHEGASAGRALNLSAGELGGPVGQAVLEADGVDHLVVFVDDSDPQALAALDALGRQEA